MYYRANNVNEDLSCVCSFLDALISRDGLQVIIFLFSEDIIIGCLYRELVDMVVDEKRFLYMVAIFFVTEQGNGVHKCLNVGSVKVNIYKKIFGHGINFFSWRKRVKNGAKPWPHQTKPWPPWPHIFSLQHLLNPEIKFLKQTI